MAAYRRVYDSRHLQVDCQEPGSAPEPYARLVNRVWATFTFLVLHCVKDGHQNNDAFSRNRFSNSRFSHLFVVISATFRFIYYEQQRAIRPLTGCSIQQCINDRPTMFYNVRITQNWICNNLADNRYSVINEIY